MATRQVSETVGKNGTHTQDISTTSKEENDKTTRGGSYFILQHFEL